TTRATRLDDILLSPQRLRPADIARLGLAVAHALDASAPAPTQLSDELQELAGEIADTLKAANKPLIVTGTSLGDPAIIQAADNAAKALAAVNDEARAFITLAEANSLGLAMMEENDIEWAFKAIEEGRADTLV